MRRYNKGWRLESERHSLAAKGVKTGKSVLASAELGAFSVPNALFMKNQDVADAFAEGATQGEAGHLFIDGDTIYSYGHHFPIARRIAPNKFLFTTKGYSQTTAVHKGRVMRALERAGYDIALVDDVMSPPKEALTQSGSYSYGAATMTGAPIPEQKKKHFWETPPPKPFHPFEGAGRVVGSAAHELGSTLSAGLFSPLPAGDDIEQAVSDAKHRAEVDAAYQKAYALEMAYNRQDIEWALQPKSFTDPNLPLPSIVAKGKKPYHYNIMKDGKIWAVVPTKEQADMVVKRYSALGLRSVRRKKPIMLGAHAKRDRLKGGLADKVPYSKFDKKELARGTKVEMEHTKDKKIAKEIASDHIYEHPSYYSELAKMEKKLERR
jgi:hypothetical protein